MQPAPTPAAIAGSSQPFRARKLEPLASSESQSLSPSSSSLAACRSAECVPFLAGLSVLGLRDTAPLLYDFVVAFLQLRPVLLLASLARHSFEAAVVVVAGLAAGSTADALDDTCAGDADASLRSLIKSLRSTACEPSMPRSLRTCLSSFTVRDPRTSFIVHPRLVKDRLTPFCAPGPSEICAGAAVRTVASMRPDWVGARAVVLLCCAGDSVRTGAFALSVGVESWDTILLGCFEGLRTE